MKSKTKNYFNYAHMRTCHINQIPPAPISKPSKWLQYQICSKFMSNKYSLRSHIEAVHEKITKFNGCKRPEKFYSKKGVTRHSSVHEFQIKRQSTVQMQLQKLWKIQLIKNLNDVYSAIFVGFVKDFLVSFNWLLLKLKKFAGSVRSWYYQANILI